MVVFSFLNNTILKVCKLLAYSTQSQWWGCHLSLWVGWFSVGFLPLAFEGPPSPQGSGADFGPPWVFYFPSTRHLWWAFPYSSPGEVLDGRPATPHENLFLVYLYLSISTYFGWLWPHHQEKKLCLCDTWYLLFCVDCLVCRRTCRSTLHNSQ